jgi:hypothetical protein
VIDTTVCIHMTETLFDTLGWFSVQHGVGGSKPRMFVRISGDFVSCKINFNRRMCIPIE